MEGGMRHIGKSIPQKIQATRVFQSGEEFGSLRLLQELKQDSPSLTRKRVIGALGDMLERNTVWRIGQGCTSSLSQDTGFTSSGYRTCR
jgi:hypothetical protein